MDDCIEFEGMKSPKGYGLRRFQGKRLLAHRVAFFEANGYWPKVCRHKCDNPPCINVEHLEDGTQGDNIRDMDERGRRGKGGARGARHGHAKLSPEAVKVVRWMADHGTTQVRLARAYGVHVMTISDVVRRKNWKEIA